VGAISVTFEQHLSRVAAAATAASAARDTLLKEMRLARRAGASLRAVAAAAGLSHETVRKMLGET